MSVAGDDLAHQRIGADRNTLGVGCAYRHRTQLTAGRGPVDVFDGGAVLRVEEAGRATYGKGFAFDPGANALGGVTAVFERLGDVADVSGFGDLLEGLLGDVVRVECLLVVLRTARVEVDSRGDDIEFGDFLTE